MSLMNYRTSEFLRGLTDLKAKGTDSKKLISLITSFMMRLIASDIYGRNYISSRHWLCGPMSRSSVFYQFKNAIIVNNSKILTEIKYLESKRIDKPQGEFEPPSDYRKRTGKFHQERTNEISDLKSTTFSEELLTSFLKTSFLQFMDEHQLEINQLMEIPRCHYKIGNYNINKEYLDISLMIENSTVQTCSQPRARLLFRHSPSSPYRRGQHSDYIDNSDYKINIPASDAEKVVTSFRRNGSHNLKLLLRGTFTLQYELEKEHYFSVIHNPKSFERINDSNYFSNYQYKCTKIDLIEENTGKIFQGRTSLHPKG